jgi:hypothetical protein
MYCNVIQKANFWEENWYISMYIDLEKNASDVKA